METITPYKTTEEPETLIDVTETIQDIHSFIERQEQSVWQRMEYPVIIVLLMLVAYSNAQIIKNLRSISASLTILQDMVQDPDATNHNPVTKTKTLIDC